MRLTTILFLSLSLIATKERSLFSSKSIESHMVKVSERLFANKYETTNAEYREFINWVATNNPESANTVKVRDEGWNQLMNQAYAVNYFKHDYYDEHPVVNITYEGATAFCEWITDRYNNERKRKFNKVKFRLPTREEWMQMASNGLENPSLYPWGGPFLKNKKGCYLAQFFQVGNQDIKIDINDRNKIDMEAQFTEDGNRISGGLVSTARVDSHIATGAGFHNLSGNAAEMLAEKGSTKGGSWGSSGYYLRINAEDEFKDVAFSPYVGFRYVMEIIQE